MNSCLLALALVATASAQCDPAEAAGYTLVSSVAIPTLTDNWDTAANFASATITNPGMPAYDITRVAYCMKLGDQWVWTSFDQTDKTKTGVPTDFVLDTTVANLNVYGSDGTSVTGSSGGKVEFWDHCYGTSGGNSGMYDHDDSWSGDNCYGSMQVHDGTTTEFGFNGWSHGSYCDVTIGNGSGSHTDGTFLRNCNNYQDGVSSISTYVKEVSAIPAVDCAGAWSTTSVCTPACETNCTDTETYTYSIFQAGDGDDCDIANGAQQTGTEHTGDTCPVDCVGAWSTTSVCTPVCHAPYGNAAANTCFDTMTYTHSVLQAGTGDDCDDAHGATSTDPNLSTERTSTACTPTCSVTCSVDASIVKVSHNTATQHTHHRCYLDQVSQTCICTCAYAIDGDYLY